MNPDWILIADANGARLLEQQGRAFVELHSFEPPAASRFAGELADFLEAGAQHGLCRSVRVFAPKPFLGELSAQLGRSTRRLLAGTHATESSALATMDVGPWVAPPPTASAAPACN